MTAPTANDLARPMSGLLLMTAFTLAWAVIAENALANRDHRLVGLVFLVVILFFCRAYAAFYKAQRGLSIPSAPAPDDAEKARDKRFMLIFGLEGLAILVVKNVLVNIGRDDWFIPCVALIIGLHFFPLARLFQRRFDNYLGVWTCAVALLGLALLLRQKPVFLVQAVVGIGCALATAANGLRLVREGYQAAGQLSK